MYNKRIPALILAALLTASASIGLVGCSDNNLKESAAESSAESGSIESESAPAETEEYISDSLDSPNFDGYEFRIHQARKAGEYITAIEYTGEPINDALFESKCYIENRFNVEVTLYDSIDPDPAFTAVKNSIIANDNAFDIVIANDGNMCDFALQGYLYDLNQIPQFDFDQPWWPEKAMETLMVNDKLYFASNYMSYQGLHWTRAVIVNKDIAEEYNIEIPYDDVRNGTWTLDKMYTLVSQTAVDANGNGKIDEDEQAGLTGSNYYALQIAVDIPIYRHDSEGMIYMDVNVEQIDKYVETCRKLFDTTHYLTLNTDGHGQQTFNKGKTFMAYSEIGGAYDLYKDSDFRYGFLSSPKLDEFQTEYINCCTDQPWGAAVNADDEKLEIVGYICEAMSCYNYNKVLPVYFEASMKSRIADQPDDSEMLQLIRDTRSLSFAFTYDLDLDDIYKNIGKNQNAASYLARYEKAGTRMLDRFLEKFED